MARTLGGRLRLTAIAVVAAAALAACSTASDGTSGKAISSGVFGSVPKAGTDAQSGGDVTIGVLDGDSGSYILPIIPAANDIIETPDQFVDLMFSPLYFQPTGASPVIDPGLSIAKPPTFSDGDTVVTIAIKPGRTWASGAPVDANDVIFSIDLLKAAVHASPANFGNYSPGFFPDNVVKATATGKYTVTLTLNKPYNPSFFYQDQLIYITPMPSTSWDRDSANGAALDFTQPANATKIYNFLASQAQDLATYGSNPLWQDVDGPMRLTSFTPSTGAYTMVPNGKYSGPQKAKISELKTETFTTPQAEFDALATGSLTIGLVDITEVTQVSRLEGQYDVFGEPSFGPNTIVFNFKDSAGHVASMFKQLYIRQALAHLVNQPGYLTGLYKGAAEADYGPVPVLPKNPYTPANSRTNPYPYSISAAAKLLSSHGWRVVKNGTTTCVRAGTGSSQCGAGIPAGTAMKFNLIYKNNLSILVSQMEAFAQAAKQVGVDITPTSGTPAFINSHYNDAAFPANDNQWAMRFGGFELEPYPTTFGIYNSGGPLNEGGYSDAKADELINNSVYGSNPKAVTNEAAYLTQNLPALFQPGNDLLVAVRKNLSASSPDAFTALTQYQWLPWQWYFAK